MNISKLDTSKYIIKKIVNSEDKSIEVNSLYIDHECILTQVEEGKKAWLFVRFPEEDTINEWHRVHTSEVQAISIIETSTLEEPVVTLETITIETLDITYVLVKKYKKARD